ncbi:RhsD protein [Patulibacter medicamentivorans]|uniref:RhsD protein n=1 Tax=Patulibacter medicamentivorans TaxID=1097667 RepID=H0E1W3_9ACTN|nr:RhsD protein [Patulibacter medicamentivorans]
MGLGVGSLGAVGGIAIAAGDEQRPVAPAGPQLQDMQPFIDRQAKEDRERIAEAERVGPLELAGLSDEEALRALRKRLPGLVGRKATAQLDAKKGERVKRYVGLGTQALVEDEKTGRKQLVQSSLPLRVPTSDEEGAPLEPLSTEVEARGDELAAENVPSQYRIARRLGASSGLPNHASSWFTEARFGVVPLAGGRPLGGGQAKLLSDKSVVLNAARDLDYVTAAGAGGSQGMFVLRSKRSPTRLGIRVVGDVDEVREGERRLGAEIVRGRTVVGRLQAPIAADANGTSVPVDWKLDGDVMRMAVDLDDPAIRLPVVVDPSVVEDQRYWVSNTAIDFTGWEFGSATPSFYPTAKGTGFYGYGLTIYSDSTKTFPAGTFGTWTFRAPFDPAFIDEGAHIINVDFGYTAHVPAGGTGSCMQQGIYDPRNTTASYPAGQFENAYWKFGTPTSTTAGPYYGYGGGLGMYTCAAEGTMWNTATYKYRTHGMTQPFDWNGSSPTAGRPANMAVFGLSNGVGKPSANGLAYLGSSLIRMSEQVAPHLTTTGQPTGWVHTAPGFTATATDYGLGSTQVSAAASGMATQTSTPPACLSTSLNPPTGVNPNNGVGNQGDRNNRCPKVLSKAIDTSALPEGANTVTLTGKDLMDNQATLAVPVKVDRSKPTIEQLNPGQVVRPEAPAGSGAPTKISVKAKDQYSGVKTVSVTVDGQPVTVTQPTCAAGECPVEYSFDIPASQLRDGQHRVDVTVTDQVDGAATIANHRESLSFVVTVYHDPTNPPTDPGAQLGRQPVGGLGFEDWWTYDTTETGAGSNLRVNLANGNATWAYTPVSNPGIGLDTFLRLTYNSYEPSGLFPNLLDSGNAGIGAYSVAGRGFSVQLAGFTRLNEKLEIKGPGGIDLLPAVDPQAFAKGVILTDGDGTQHYFERDDSKPGIRFKRPAGVEIELRRFDDNSASAKYWAATRADGVTAFFDREGWATGMQDRHGNRMEFVLETVGTKPGCGSLLCTKRVRYIRDAAALDKTGLEAAGTQAEVQAARQWTLTYDDDNANHTGAGRLVSIEDRKVLPGGQRRLTTFAYGSDRLEKITEAANGPAAQKRSFQLGYLDATSGYLTSVRDPRNNTTSVAYTAAPSAFGSLLGPVLDPLLQWTGIVPNLKFATAVTDRGGRERRYRFDAPSSAGQSHETWVLSDRDATSAQGTRTRVDKVTVDGAGRMTDLTQAADDPATQGVNEAAASPRRSQQHWTGDNYVGWSSEALEEPTKTVTTEYEWGDLGQLRSETEHFGTAGAGGTPTRSRSWGYNEHWGTIHNADEDDSGTSPAASGIGPFVFDVNREVDRNGKATDYDYTPPGDVVGGDPDRGDLYKLRRDGAGDETFRYTPRGLMTKHTQKVWDDAPATGSFWEGESAEVDEEWSLFDGNGDPALRLDQRDRPWTTARDEVGNVVRLLDPRAGVPTVTVAAEAPLATSDNPAVDLGAVRTAARLQGDKFVARWTYDALDRQVAAAIPKSSGILPAENPDRFRVTATSYDLNDNVIAARDGNGEIGSSTYTATDKLATRTSPSVEHHVDAPEADDDLPTTQTSGTPEVTRYSYDKADNVKEQSDPLGALGSGAHRTSWTYDLFDEPTVRVQYGAAADDQAKLVTSRAYDARGNVVGESDAKANGAASIGDAEVNAKTPAKQRTAYEYDTFDRLKSKTENPFGSPSASTQLITNYGYDGEDRPTRTTTPAGRTSITVYDDRGEVVEQKEPFKYEATGDRLTRTDENAMAVTSYKRRLDGQLYEVTSPRGNATSAAGDFVTKLGYWDTGELRVRSVPRAAGQYGDPDAWKVRYDINAVGDPELIVDARGKALTNEFLDTGELAKTTRPSFWIYDQDKQTLRERTSDDPKATQVGDAELPASPGHGDFGKVEPQALPDIVPAKGPTSFGYDDELRLNRVTAQGDVSGHVTQNLFYDPVGRLTKRTIPLAGSGEDIDTIDLSWQYDANGNTRAAIDGRKSATVYRYDSYDRLKSVTAPANCDSGSGCARPKTTQSFDPNGNVETEVTPLSTNPQVEDWDGDAGTSDATTGTKIRHYDAADRLVTEVDEAGAKTQHDYDEDGLTTVDYRPRAFSDATDATPDDDFATRYTRDGGGRVLKRTEKVDDGGSTSTLETTFEYDRNGNQTKVVSPGSAKSAGQSVEDRVQTRRYDGRDLPWVTTVGDGADARSTITEYDGNGWLRRTVKPEGVQNPGPDATPEHEDLTGNEIGVTPLQTNATKNAEVREYDDDGLLIGRNLPWGDSDNANGQHHRWRQAYGYTNRGLVSSIGEVYEVGTGSGKYNHDTLIDYNLAGWPTETNERGWTQGDDPPPSSVKGDRLVYDYDKQGNQKRWRSPGRSRDIRRGFYPSGQMAWRCGVRNDGTGSKLSEEQVFSYEYDQAGGLTKLTDWMHHQVRPETANQCQEEAVSNDGYTPDRNTLIKRDRAGRPASVNESWDNGKDTVYSYVKNAPALISEVRTDGRVSGTDFTNGTRTKYGYDLLDRNTRVRVYSPSTGTNPDRTTDLRWWPSGDRRQVTKPATTSGRTVEERFYDTAGLIRERNVTEPGDTSVSRKRFYEYDKNGNRTKDERGENDYNARDQLTKWQRRRPNPDVNAAPANRLLMPAKTEKDPGKTTTYDVDGAGRKKKTTDTIVIADGGTDVTTEVITSNEYDGDRLLKSDRQIKTWGTGLQGSRSAQSDCYAYNTFGSMTAMRREKTAKEPAGVGTEPAHLPAPGGCSTSTSPIEVQYTYDTFERLTAGRERQHDESDESDTGNLDPSQAYCYDALDRRDRRVTGLSGDDDPSGGDDVEQLRRARAACTKATPPGSDIKGHDYSYLGLTEQLTRENRDGDKIQTYEYTANGERLGRLKTDGGVPQWRAYETDAQGSVVGLESPTTGKVAEDDEYRTDPYGGPVSPEKDLGTDAEDNPFRFQGFYKDQDTGTYDMQARAYRPDIGQFLQQDRYSDPKADLQLAADPLTSSRYSFTAANPATRAEYDGHFGEGSVFGSIGASGGTVGGGSSSGKGSAGAGGGRQQGGSGADSIVRALNGAAQEVAARIIPTANDAWSDTSAGRAIREREARRCLGGVGVTAYACTGLFPLPSAKTESLGEFIKSMTCDPGKPWSCALFLGTGAIGKVGEKVFGKALGEALDSVVDGGRRRAGVANGAKPRPLPGASAAMPSLPAQLRGGASNVTVYRGINRDGKEIYIGITSRFKKRAYEHRNRFDLEPITPTPVTRGQARAIEQAGIVNARSRGLAYENKINSVSPRHDYYDDAVSWGQAWMQHNGH